MKRIEIIEHKLYDKVGSMLLVCPLQSTVDQEVTCSDKCAYYDRSGEYPINVGDTNKPIYETRLTARCKEHCLGEIIDNE